MIDESRQHRILVNIFCSFGPQTRPIKLSVQPSDSLASIKQILSHLFLTSIHTELVLTLRGEELSPSDDEKSLCEIGIHDGDSLTIGLQTPRLPLQSTPFEPADDVEVSPTALEKCLSHAKTNPKVEVGGLLIGREKDNGGLLVIDSHPIAEGDQKSVNLRPAVVNRVAEELRGGTYHPVGWYHSHVKPHFSMSGIDLRLQSAYQQLYPKAVTLLLDMVKNTAKFYRMKLVPHLLVDAVYISIPRSKRPSMDSDTVTLTTILEEKILAQITSFLSHDAETGKEASFTTTVKNIGTVELSDAQVYVVITSPDNRESITITSEPLHIPLGDSKTCEVKGRIPVSWPTGVSMVRAGVIDTVSRRWLYRWFISTIGITQSPIYDVKLKVLQTHQRVSLAQKAVYTILVKNNGNRRDSIEITWDTEQVPEPWRAQIYDAEKEMKPPFIITLEPGSTHRLTLIVSAPSLGCGGTQVPISLKARSLSAHAQAQPTAAS